MVEPENYWRVRGYCHSVSSRELPDGKLLYTLRIGYAEDELCSITAIRGAPSARLESLAGSGWLIEAQGHFLHTGLRVPSVRVVIEEWRAQVGHGARLDSLADLIDKNLAAIIVPDMRLTEYEVLG